MRPTDLKYTESHEWIRIERDEAVIGITDYAIKELSDLVHVELPDVGESLEQDAPFGEVESVKAVSDLIAPLSGQVTAVNEEIAADMDLLAEDPYDEGWLIKLHVDDPTELESLMTAEEYEEFIKAEEAGAKEEKEEEEEDDEDEEEEDEDEDEEPDASE
ncbi:MAG: glycine cleavage system protein GcvH [Planctomycetes bacterium]|nr:glycine cleavage system protein GcvH [Planctomycetota bacterium]